MNESILNDFIQAHISEEPPLLHELYRYTNLHHWAGHMASGHNRGRILAMLSKMIRPSRILEIGTFTGYSALCLAEGLIHNGSLDTIESDQLACLTAEKFFQRSTYSNQINLLKGDACYIIPTLSDNTYDIIFMDGAKKQYTELYHLCLPKLKTNAYLLVDNVLWYNQIHDPSQNDDTTNALRTFLQTVANDPKTEQIILQDGDGLSIIRKLND